MELEQLNQLRCIAETGTLAEAAERLHLSPSSLSRSMQRLESDLGLDLFDRTKNRIRLNDAGRLAVEHAVLVLGEAQRMEEALRDLHRASYTLRVGVCAPAPLWRLVPALADRAPDLLVMPEMLPLKTIEQRLFAESLDFAILPYRLDVPNAVTVPIMNESLYASLPEGHPLCDRDDLSLADLDGETFLLYAGIGFWREICERHMPHAHYVVQSDYLVFSQLSQTSPLPGFVTNVSEGERAMASRRIVALADDDVHVTFYLTALDRPGFRWCELMEWVGKRIDLG